MKSSKQTPHKDLWAVDAQAWMLGGIPSELVGAEFSNKPCQTFSSKIIPPQFEKHLTPLHQPNAACARPICPVAISTRIRERISVENSNHVFQRKNRWYMVVQLVN